MEIIGKDKYLKEGKKENISKAVGDLNTLTKALILTLQITDKEKAKKLKADYLEDIVKKAVEKSLKDKPKDEKQRILMLEELELEIQQKKLEVIRNSLKGE